MLKKSTVVPFLSLNVGIPPEFNSKTDTNRNYKIISSKIFTNIFIVKKIISIALHSNMGIYYLENIPWMWFMTFRALFILTNWAVVWGRRERNYLVSILLNNQMDNYEMIRFTDNKILFFIVIKIMILSSTLYVIVLL